jgi:tRNA G18 (ribose-2'-O)-methylase SpoU
MAAPQPEHTFPSYLVITNISKKQNISTLISIAVGFGIENILIGNRGHISFAVIIFSHVSNALSLFQSQSANQVLK